MRVKKIVRQLHLWLGLSSGALIVFMGITGCLLAFEREIETLQSFRYVAAQEKSFVPPSVLKKAAEQALPGKLLKSVLYGGKGEAAQLFFYNNAPEYYYIVFIDPYTAGVQKVKNMDNDFFRIIINGHFYLWLPPNIGQPIVATVTLVFLLMIISGLILWWPRNKPAAKQRFTIKWNARWRRKNYDLHYVLGFYMTWVALFIALTGLVWGFQWFAKSMYWTMSGGKSLPAYYEPVSVKPAVALAVFSPEDKVWEIMKAGNKSAETIEIYFAANDSSIIMAASNPDAGTNGKTSYRRFDQYSFKEIPAANLYGSYDSSTVADKITRRNYDIHTGQILGLPGKILAFFASLIAASLPVTGFYIWWGKEKSMPVNPPGQIKEDKTVLPFYFLY